MKKKKLLFVCEKSYPEFIGGAERSIFDTAFALSNTELYVTLLSAKQKHTKIQKKHKLKRIYYYPDYSNFVFRILSIFLALKTKLKFIPRIDILKACTPFPAFCSFTEKKFRSTPKILLYFSPVFLENILLLKKSWRKNIKAFIRPFYLIQYAIFAHIIEKLTIKKADLIITHSNYMKNLLLKYHNADAKKIFPIYPGVDTTRFNPFINATTVKQIRKNFVSHNEIMLLTVRRLTGRMGIDNLIKAMPQVLKKFPRTKLVIGGTGFHRTYLENLVSSLNLKDKIIFTGFIKDELLPFYYKASDLFVIPTASLEGFGLVAAEAMACSTCVLATNTGGLIEVVGKFDKAYLIPGTKPDNISKKIIEILDKKMYKIHPYKLFEYINENFTYKLHAKKFIQLLKLKNLM